MTTLSPAFLQHIAAAIVAAGGECVGRLDGTAMGHGDISAAFRLSAGDQAYFLKTHEAERLAMFEAEAAALTEIAATNTVRVPRAICSGSTEGRAYLVLEWIEMHPLDAAAAGRLGRSLAALHRHRSTRFGWHRDNTIGATPQPNKWQANWLLFWSEQRLGYQLQLAADNGYYGKVQILGHKLLKHCDRFFAAYAPVPSLLHGDLWSGNAGCDAAGEPLIYDPASYYGDHEADLAMTSLFGGFPHSFMAAYEEVWPVDRGHRMRRDFYNLYHLLNHLNLFGRGYLVQCESVMQRLLADLGE